MSKWERDVERKAKVLEEAGTYNGWDGAVLPEKLVDVARRLENAKQRFLEREARTLTEREEWEKACPFKDSR